MAEIDSKREIGRFSAVVSLILVSMVGAEIVHYPKPESAGEKSYRV